MEIGKATIRPVHDGDKPPLEIRATTFGEETNLWNEQIARVSDARIQQSLQGARIRAEMEGTHHFFLRAFRGDELVGQLTAQRGFVHPEYVQWARPLLKTRFMHRLWGVYRWLFGPIIHDRSNCDEILWSLLHYVDERARRDKVAAILNVTAPFYQSDFDRDTVDRVYAECGFSRREAATIVLDLAGRDSEELWMGLAKEARQKVKKAKRLGISAFEDNSVDGLRKYYAVRLENARRNGLRPPHIDSVLVVEPVYMRDGLSKLFLAEWEGQIVAGQMLVVFNGNVQLGGICYSDVARERRLPVNDLVQWHVIQWAREQGHRLIDWSGYTPQPKSEKEEGINKFKSKWGGRVIPYSIYDKYYEEMRRRCLSYAKEKVRNLDIR